MSRKPKSNNPHIFRLVLFHGGLAHETRTCHICACYILCVGWCGTYLFRVGTKNMTYTQQLKDYEEAVMEKRLEEMSETEIEDILNQGKPEPSEAEGP